MTTFFSVGIDVVQRVHLVGRDVGGRHTIPRYAGGLLRAAYAQAPSNWLPAGTNNAWLDHGGAGRFRDFPDRRGTSQETPSAAAEGVFH